MNQKSEVLDGIDLTKHKLLNIAKNYGNGNTEAATIQALEHPVNRLIEIGRVSVLIDFDNMCAADAIVGFTSDELAVIKKFFAWNKSISGWDK